MSPGHATPVTMSAAELSCEKSRMLLLELGESRYPRKTIMSVFDRSPRRMKRQLIPVQIRKDS